MEDSPYHPDLRRIAKALPRGGGERMLRLGRHLERVHRGRLRRGSRSCRSITPACRVHTAPLGTREPGPALLWIHGGGYVGGSARLDDKLCRRFAEQLGIVVAAVDYRLAPEHPFPAGLDDCYAASAMAGAAQRRRRRPHRDRRRQRGRRSRGRAGPPRPRPERDQRGDAAPLVSDARRPDGGAQRHRRTPCAPLEQPLECLRVALLSRGAARLRRRHRSRRAGPARRPDRASADVDGRRDARPVLRRRRSLRRAPAGERRQCRLDVVEGAFHGFDVVAPACTGLPAVLRRTS